LISNAEGTFLYSKAFQARSTGDIVALFIEARDKFKAALSANPTDKTTLKLLAMANLKILEFTVSNGKNIANVKFDMKDPQTCQTDRLFLRALDENNSAHLLLIYARFLVRCGRNERAHDYYLRSLEVDPNEARCLDSYADFLNELGHTHMANLFYIRKTSVCHYSTLLIN
jgi:tetratricopeptide (TPR) repeat protein